MVLLADALCGDLQELFQGVYRIAGPKVAIIGGAAGDEQKFISTFVFHDDRVVEEGAAALWIASDLLMAMAYRIGLALEQAQRTAQIEHIVRGERRINRQLDQSALCTAVVQEFPQIVHADVAALVTGDFAGVLHCVVQHGLERVPDCCLTEIAERLRDNPSIANGDAYSIQDIQVVARAIGIDVPEGCSFHALLAVPIRRDEKMCGLLMAMRSSTAPFCPDVLQVSRLYAAQVSAATENARLYGALQDELQERIRVDRALQASHERFRALIHSVSDVIIITQADNTIGYASPATATVWEVSCEALLGQSLFSRVHPDDLDALSALLTQVQKSPGTTMAHAILDASRRTRVARIRGGVHQPSRRARGRRHRRHVS